MNGKRNANKGSRPAMPPLRVLQKIERDTLSQCEQALIRNFRRLDGESSEIAVRFMENFADETEKSTRKAPRPTLQIIQGGAK